MMRPNRMGGMAAPRVERVTCVHSRGHGMPVARPRTAREDAYYADRTELCQCVAEAVTMTLVRRKAPMSQVPANRDWWRDENDAPAEGEP
jgi:hypothetical protein